MLNYSALASAVILKAHDDLFGENRFFDAKPFRRREKDREDAREFLTKENEELKFWCVVGGLSMKAIVEKTLNQVEETKNGVRLSGPAVSDRVQP